MKVIHTISELRSALAAVPKVAFVPTMGNLHAGHIQLAKIAKKNASCVVVSIFVNPLQFGPNEDFAAYPRTLEADCEKLAGIADIVFAPSVTEMYPDFDGKHLNQSMSITPPAIANELCGASRPGHFSGVATVVMKLFNIVQPQIAVFGKKDYQQLFILKELVKQFNLPIKIIAGDTMREASGLAMSSRNGYLSQAELVIAPQLNSTLQNMISQIQQGNLDFSALENVATQQLNANGWTVDYVSVRNANTLLKADSQDKKLVVLAAAKLGKTRLIDNIEVTLNA